jgi:hypothetical protein
MLKPSNIAVILGLAGSLSGLPCLSAQNNADAAGVAEAIRFQKAEDAAAARQARIDVARTGGTNFADQQVSRTKTKAAPAASQGVEAAIRFQRAEDMAAARQARIEAGRVADSNSADRMAPSKLEGTASATRKVRKPQLPQQ